MKYRKKPVVIEAIQWTGNARAVYEFINDRNPNQSFRIEGKSPEGLEKIWIETLEGPICASLNDWIICGVKGEFYPCKPDIFEQTYEAMTDE